MQSHSTQMANLSLIVCLLTINTRSVDMIISRYTITPYYAFIQNDNPVHSIFVQ